MPTAASNVPYTNRRVKFPQPAEYVEKVVSDKMYLINIWIISLVAQRSHGSYWIQGCKPGQHYTSLELRGRVEHPDLGNDESAEVPIPVKDIAADLEREFNGGIYMQSDEPKPFMGVFVSDTPKPSKERIAEANAQLREFGHLAVAQADLYWDDPKNHKEITEFHRRFAKLLDEKKPWLYEAKDLTPCGSCSQPIARGLAKCPNCHAVLDRSKLKQWHPVEYAELLQLEAANAELEASPKKKTPKEA
jgi:hypothetical protein